MTRYANAFLCLAIAAAAAGPALAKDDALNATLQTRYAAMKAAMDSADEKAMQAVFTPDFASVDISGKVTSEQDVVAELQRMPKDPNKTSTTTLLSVKQDGDKATVSQRYDMKTLKQASDGAMKKVELVAVSTDTWVKSHSQWMMQRTVTKQVDILFDGVKAMHKDAAP